MEKSEDFLQLDLRKTISPADKVKLFSYYGATCSIDEKAGSIGEKAGGGNGLTKRIKQIMGKLCNTQVKPVSDPLTNLQDLNTDVLWHIIKNAQDLDMVKNLSLVSKELRKTTIGTVKTSDHVDYVKLFAKHIESMINCAKKNGLATISLIFGERIGALQEKMGYHNALVYRAVHIVVQELTCTVSSVFFDNTFAYDYFRGKSSMQDLEEAYLRTSKYNTKSEAIALTLANVDIEKINTLFNNTFTPECKTEFEKLLANDVFIEYEFNSSSSLITKRLSLFYYYVRKDFVAHVLGDFEIKINKYTMPPLVEETTEDAYDWTYPYRALASLSTPIIQVLPKYSGSEPIPFPDNYSYMQLSDVYMQKLLDFYESKRTNTTEPLDDGLIYRYIYEFNLFEKFEEILKSGRSNNDKVISTMRLAHIFMNPDYVTFSYDEKITRRDKVNTKIDEFIVKYTPPVKGGNTRKKQNALAKTKIKVIYKKKKYQIFVGPRGGKYIWHDEKYINVSKLENVQDAVVVNKPKK